MLRTLALLRRIRTSVFDKLDTLLLKLAALLFLTLLAGCGQEDGTVTPTPTPTPIPVPPTGQVTGAVYDASTGIPLMATVSLDGSSSTTASPDFTLEAKAGTYTLTAEAHGHYSYTVEVLITAYRTIEQEILLEPLPPESGPLEGFEYIPILDEVGLHAPEGCHTLDWDTSFPGRLRYFVDCVIILTGPPDGIASVTESLPEYGFALVELPLVDAADEGAELERITFLEGDDEIARFAIQAHRDFWITWESQDPYGEPGPDYPYEWEDYGYGPGSRHPETLAFERGPGDWVTVVVRLINTELGPQVNVSADPNYLLGYLGGLCGGPFGPTDSPFGPTDSPFGPTDSPFGPTDSPNGGAVTASGGAADEVLDSFWGQWAFSQIGAVNRLTDTSPLSGTNVVVGVFDTSPFGDSPGAAPTSVTLSHSLPPPPALTLSVGGGPGVPNFAGNAAEHGLSVAALIHAIAPASQIRLVRVLDDEGCGTLGRLLVGLDQFITEYPSQDKVINLSLGFVPLSAVYAGTSALFGDVPPLHRKLQDAQLLGAVIVASAGNASARLAAPLGAEYPAAYPEVIGVAASTKDDTLACYSNLGDVAAPGGDGINDCEPGTATCAGFTSDQAADCEYGVISLVTTATSASGYAFWAGTSFAAPLVSGQAALLLSEGRNEQVVWNIIMDADNRQGTAGVIRIPLSLADPRR